MNTHQVHYFENAMCHSSRTCDGNLYIRQAQTKISMYEFSKTALLVNSFQFIQTGPVSISHHAIVCTYNACEETKANNPLSIVMFQTFVIDQRYLFFQYGLQHMPVARLLLLSMGKE